MVPEQLANQSFGAIADNGAADFPGSGNPKPRRRLWSCAGEYHHEPAAYTGAGFVSLLKVGPATEMLVGPKRFCAHAALSFIRDCQPLPALGATPLEHVLAVFGRHSHQEAMRFLPAAVVRLKRTLPFSH
jgi:hypothetical protein